MKKLYVYADFDWLKEMELIGELGYESLRGADSYSFTFNNEWLRQHSDLFLSDDLTYIIHSGFISGYQNRYGDNLKPPTNVYHRMTA